jgi:hypothetical protein
MENIIKEITLNHFHEVPLNIEKMTTGLINEVYKLTLSNQIVILRMNKRQTNMIGTEHNIPVFQNVGINVPSLLYSDYSKSNFSYAYQFLTFIEGEDLGKVIERLSDFQLVSLASDISTLIDRIETTPSINKYGLLCEGNIESMAQSWIDYIETYIKEASERARESNLIEKEIIEFALGLTKRFERYFNTIKPLPYYEDMCSKNVIVLNGKFVGLVDLDYISYGDYLDAFGRIYASWFDKEYGKKYLSYLFIERKLTEEHKKMVSVYGFIHKFSWTSENGIIFNSNTTSDINLEKVKNDNIKLKSMMNLISKL